MSPEDHAILADAHATIAEVHRKYQPPELKNASVREVLLAVVDRTPRRATEHVDIAKGRGYVPRSKTPAKTFEAEMARSIKDGEGLFERPRPGHYRRI